MTTALHDITRPDQRFGRVVVFATAIATAGVGTACGASQRHIEARPLDDVPSVQIYQSGADGPSPMARLSDAILEHEIVFVGEQHDQGDHHRMQAWVATQFMHAGYPVELALEMLPRTSQELADAYAAGDMTREAFVDQVWNQTWSDFELYEPLIILAEQPDVSIVTLNAPREVVHRVYETGFDSLVPSERATVAAELGDASVQYRAWLTEIFSGHGTPDPAALEHFIEAQLTWDSTMAESLATAYDVFPAETRYVVAAGLGHVQFGWGIPSQFAAMHPEASTLTVACVAVDVATYNDPALVAAELDAAMADWFIVTISN